jgi:RNA polymerase sigma-70 factor (ECF subfamily)
MDVDDRPEIDRLMARLADGDRSAFTPVFQRLWGPTLRLCTGMLRSEADAADAAQQAMTRILERASEYDPKRPALPWALGIAGWECRTLLRKRVRRRESPDATGAEPVQPGFEDDLAEADLARAAVAALGELSETDRQTLEASFWETAPAVSGATLRKRRERALVRLREAMRRLYGLG